MVRCQSKHVENGMIIRYNNQNYRIGIGFNFVMFNRFKELLVRKENTEPQYIPF